jgi:hypothetical protein
VQKLILTDIDETVLKYGEPFQAWCEATGLPTTGNLREGTSNVETMLGVSWEEAVTIMTRYLNEGHLDRQPPEPDAQEALLGLHLAGYRFVGITACGGTMAFQKARKALLEATFGFPWDALHVVPLGASKDVLLNAFDPAVWVEDHPGHAAMGAALGHRSYLLNRSYNVAAPSPGAIRVNDWHDIALDLYRSA